jgi:hypothetical protein
MANDSDRNSGDNSGHQQAFHGIVVAKGDMFVIAYVIMFCFFVSVTLIGDYHIGVLTEKVGQLEDIVFNQSYKIERVK